MPRWTDLLDALGHRGACTNAKRAIDARLQADADLEQFLARFAHPAGRARVPTERRAA